MTARIVDQRSAIWMDIFKGDPGGGKITERIRRHVDGIGMDTLLRTFVRRDRLQMFRLMSGQQPDPLQKSGMLEDPAECGEFFMRIEEAAGIRIVVRSRVRR